MKADDRFIKHLIEGCEWDKVGVTPRIDEENMDEAFGLGTFASTLGKADKLAGGVKKAAGGVKKAAGAVKKSAGGFAQGLGTSKGRFKGTGLHNTDAPDPATANTTSYKAGAGIRDFVRGVATNKTTQKARKTRTRAELAGRVTRVGAVGAAKGVAGAAKGVAGAAKLAGKGLRGLYTGASRLNQKTGGKRLPFAIENTESLAKRLEIVRQNLYS